MATASVSEKTFTLQDQQGKNIPLIHIGFGIHLPQAAWTKGAQAVLTEPVCQLIAALHAAMQDRRRQLLEARAEMQAKFDAGQRPEYLEASSEAVLGKWAVRPIPEDLKTRRVEITGPVNSTKMVIQMLSRTEDGARADCAMLDFEDSMKPSWINVIDGFHNAIGAAAGVLSFEDEAKGKRYKLNPDDQATVMIRARGLHLAESNVMIEGAPISAGLFDLAVCFYHTTQKLLDRGRTPKYYIPKVQTYQEARWWDDLFTLLEEKTGFPLGTLRATFLIETLTAAFQIEEILYELREHAAGLNVGRWDKIFSDIKTLRAHKDRIMPDRAGINLSCFWMKNYALRLIHICHKRGAFALGGMAAFTPGKSAEIRQVQTDKVLADKQMEFNMGHDGCWVSHPYFIGPAMRCFLKKNQLDVLPNLENRYPDLLPEPKGDITWEGLRTNIRVGIAYIYGWQHDIGCIAWDDLMEDLATLEISRAQIWQWLNNGVQLSDGTAVNETLVTQLFEEEVDRILKEVADDEPGWQKAKASALELFTKKEFPEFLTLQSEIAQ